MRFLSMPASMLAAALASVTGAGSVTLTVDPALSSSTTSLELAAPLAGTFKGDFDARTNPGGTQTRPGLFGGSGNNPIPYSADLAIGDSTSTAPSGGLAIQVDLEALSATLDGLVIDLLGGADVSIATTLTITYSNFNTINPGAIFPGGVPIPVPLGDVADVTSLVATQSAPVVATLSGGAGGIYDIAALVPVDVVAELTVLETPVGDGAPIPLVLPILGTLDLSQPGEIILSFGAAEKIAVSSPVELPPIVDLPFGLPTILPLGGTANLLVSGTIADVNFVVDVDVAIVATGSFDACIAADLNCDGIVDGADLGLLLNVWGTSGPFGDLNGDGAVDGADLGLLLNAWG